MYEELPMTAIKPVNSVMSVVKEEASHARCPRCHTWLPGLFVRDSILQTTEGTPIGSVWCDSCKQMMHWDYRALNNKR